MVDLFLKIPRRPSSFFARMKKETQRGPSQKSIHMAHKPGLFLDEWSNLFLDEPTKLFSLAQ
jgi:hypothetical protein